MAILRRIAPGSAFKLGLVINGFLGLLLGAFCTLLTIAGVRFAPHAQMPFGGRIGLFAVILCPIIYGIIGGIGATIGAVIYNLASDWVGGVEVDLG